MVFMWPILLGVAGLIYSSLTIRAFLNTRRQFSQVLSASHSGLNMSRYFRLMALAATELLFSLPFSLYIFINNFKNLNDLNPWISWADTHQNFGKINFIPWIFIESSADRGIGFAVNRWALPAGGILFFMYFGIAGEASAEYRKWFWAIAGRFGIKKSPKAAHSKWCVPLSLSF